MRAKASSKKKTILIIKLAWLCHLLGLYPWAIYSSTLKPILVMWKCHEHLSELQNIRLVKQKAKVFYQSNKHHTLL